MSNKVFDAPNEYVPVKETTSSNVLTNTDENDSSLLKNVRQEEERRRSEIRPVLVLIENPADLTDDGFRKTVFPKLSFGLRKAGELVAYLTYQYKNAVDAKKRAMAVAALDDFPGYAEKNELKQTDAIRAHYVFINEGVRAAQEREAMVEAMLENAKTIKQEIVMALSIVKAMVYGLKDTDFLSSQASGEGT